MHIMTKSFSTEFLVPPSYLGIADMLRVPVVRANASTISARKNEKEENI